MAYVVASGTDITAFVDDFISLRVFRFSRINQNSFDDIL